ncbi:MAG TPA: SAM-dependent methyltransferase [Chthoniobacteraceae bacterium]|jgi:SAM-dependent MidA family methyltransferase|nr:SAM-dependent methyltransferase [Chthoniobacteraceae bacterium]
MNPIQAILAERGTVTFRDFMELALYHPEHGYYGGGHAELGRGGDFFTNVSVGVIFGELLAWQFREMWERLGRPGRFTIIEQGAHDGTFAADVLAWCRAEAPDFFEALQYEIVEGLPALRQRQGKRLEGYPVTWSNALEEVAPFAGVHFSNELIDAFPVHLVRFRDGNWRELCVTPELQWAEQTADSLASALEYIPRVEGYTTEISLAAPRWAAALAPKIERGWALAVDYGFPRARYYAPERKQGTLQCYARHTKGLDPLGEPGSRDLTAHVDFTTVTEAFLAAGMDLAGYTDQHHFLTGLVARIFAEHAPTAQQTRGLKTLLHPEMLGTSFQVLGVSRGIPPGPPLAGFQYARDAGSALGVG